MFRPPPLRRTLEAALRDIHEAKASVRASAISDLIHYAEECRERVLASLERALRDDEAAEVRSAAALALADVGGNEALPSLLVAVEDEHVHVRQMALTALGEIGDPRARERLRRALSDDRPETRFQAVVAFARVAPDEADTAIAGALSDKDAHVRYIAIRTAEELADRDQRPMSGPIIESMRSLVDDPDPAVRVGAAVALAQSGDPTGAAVLLAVVARRISTPELEDEAAAVELVGALQLAEAVASLEVRAFGISRFLRQTFAWQAKVALARMGHPRAIESIVRDLDARSRDRRTLAVAAIGRARLYALRSRMEAMCGNEAFADPDALLQTLDALEGAVSTDAEPGATETTSAQRQDATTHRGVEDGDPGSGEMMEAADTTVARRAARG